MGVNSIGVVIPARNEASEIVDCLATVDVAIRSLHRSFPTVSVEVYVVADACTDSTAATVQDLQHAQWPGTLVVTDHQNVGKARASGVDRYLADADPNRHAPDAAWIATTDADSRVPPHWFIAQVQLAATGVDCVVGTVEPREETASAELLEGWFARHTLEEGHPHIFGANLGVRASWYTRVGGFRPLATGEDVALVKALQEHGARVVATDTARVATSARLHGRVSDGFSTYCQGL